MRNLVIDIGNTRVKYGIFYQDELVEEQLGATVNLEDISRLATNHAAENIIYSSVAEFWPQEWTAFLEQNYRVWGLNEHTALPFVNAYATPATLGKDRLAAVAGAQYFYPTSNCLVVDAGTCVTMDLLRADATYLGGNISPGVKMRLRSMHEFTARLPLVEPSTVAQIWGTTTTTALQNGGGLGVALEIEALASRLKRQWPDLKLLLTGGDASFLANSIECEIFVHSNLVLYGLHKILTYNVEHLA
jgi:type III pantothenate kinase